MEDTFFKRIKKDYAVAVIEDLQKMDAVEVISEENITTPQWQIDKVREAVKHTEENLATLLEWATVKQNIKRRQP